MGTALSNHDQRSLILGALFEPLPAPTCGDSHLHFAYFVITASRHDLVQQAPHIPSESGAESDRVDIKACLALRKQFKQRNDLLKLTINDLLILYRAIHAATYKPSAKLLAEIDKLSETKPEVAASLHPLVEEGSRAHPSILIPVDASLKVPRELIYLLNVDVPLMALNLLGLHSQTMRMLKPTRRDTG